MADDLKEDIQFGANTTGAEAGINRIKKALGDVGSAAGQAGQAAASGMGAAGEGGERASKKVEVATRSMQASLQRLIAEQQAGSKSSREYWEALAAQRNVNVNALKPLLDQLDAYKTKAADATRATENLGGGVSALGAAAGMAGRALAVLGVAASARELIAMADASTTVASRLALVTSSTAELIDVQRRLFQVAQSSRVSYTDLVVTYAQVARATKELGVSQRDLLDVTKTISQAVTISGGSAQSAQAALVQLAQGFASGALRGEELNSIMEQTPRLAQAIADGLGVSVGKLRELGGAGELTADKVLGALKKSAGSVQVEFDKMATTVEQSITRLGNSMTGLIGAMDSLLGVTKTIGSAFGQLSQGMDAVADIFNKLGKQGPLRDAAGEVRRLDDEARRLRQGIDRGLFGPAAQAELDRINTRLELAKQRFRDLDKELGGAKDPRDQTGYVTRTQSYAAEAKRLEGIQASMGKVLNGLSGVKDGFYKDLNALYSGYQNGLIKLSDYQTAVAKLIKESGSEKPEGASAIKAEQSAYESLAASIKTKIAQNDEELKYSGRLTEADKLRLQMMTQLDVGSKKLSAAHKATALALLETLDAQERQKAATQRAIALYQEQVSIQEELNAAYAAESKAREAGRQAVTDYVKGITENNEALQFELSLMGMSEQAREVALEQYRIELELKRQIAAVNANSGFDQPQRDEEIARLTGAAAIAKANASSKVFLGEWKNSVKQYDDIFRQGFADMLNNGQNGWKSFTRSLATTFKTTVADTLYKAFAQPFVIKLVGQLLGLTGGGGAAGIANTVSSGGSLLSGIGNIGSLFGGGGAFSSGLSMALNGGIGTALEGGFAMLGSASGFSSALAGIGQIAGALGPIALGIGALVALAGSFKGETRVGGQFGVAYDGSVTNQRRGQSYTYVGQQYDRDFSNGQRIGLTNGDAYRLEGDPVDMAQEDAIRKAVSGTAAGINAMLKALGSASTVTGFWAGLETSEKGRGGVFAGGKTSDGKTFGETGTGDNYAGTLYEKFSTNSPDFKQALENFTLDLKQSTIQALQTVDDIPATIKKMIDVDAEALTSEAADALLIAINAQIAGVTTFKAALDAMGLDKLATLSFDAAAAIGELSGGFDKLQANLGTYYDKFFSDDERRANLKKQLEKQLGDLDLKLPDIDATDARAQYRRLIEAQDENTEAGRKAIAVLLQLAGAFDSIAAAGEDAAAAAAEAARKQQSITDKGRDLEQRLLIAQGKDRQALDLRRLQEYYALLNLNPALAAMVIEIYKAEDAAEALVKAEQAREDAYSKLQNAATLESERLNAQLEAIDAQRTAINKQRELSQESLSLITGVFDLVRSNARDLYGQVDSTASMQAAQGWAFVEKALSNAQATGYLPDQNALQEAIAAARSGVESGSYVSQFAQDRDRLVLAGTLSGLEAISGGQKTIAEQQLASLKDQSEALDAQTDAINRQLKLQQEMLDYWRRQIDIANGTFDATLSVADAITALTALLRPKDQGANVNTKAPPQVNGGGASWGGGSTPTAAPAAAKYSQVMSAGTAGVWYEPIIDQDLIARLDALAPVYHAYDGTGDLRGLLEATKAAGGTMQMLSILSGFYQSDWVKAGATVGIPAFAVGTNFVPRDMVAKIHEGEAIVPKAFNPWANGGAAAWAGAADQAQLLEEVRALRKEVAALRGAADRTADNTQTLPQMVEQFDDVSQGGNSLRFEEMA